MAGKLLCFLGFHKWDKGTKMMRPTLSMGTFTLYRCLRPNCLVAKRGGIMSTNTVTALDLLKAMGKEIDEQKSEKGYKYFIDNWWTSNGGNKKRLIDVAEEYFETDSGKLAVIKLLESQDEFDFIMLSVEGKRGVLLSRDDVDKYFLWQFSGINHSQDTVVCRSGDEACLAAAKWVAEQMKGERG